jgi:hypothetical protein
MAILRALEPALAATEICPVDARGRAAPAPPEGQEAGRVGMWVEMEEGPGGV